MLLYIPKLGSEDSGENTKCETHLFNSLLHPIPILVGFLKTLVEAFIIELASLTATLIVLQKCIVLLKLGLISVVFLQKSLDTKKICPRYLGFCSCIKPEIQLKP